MEKQMKTTVISHEELTSKRLRLAMKPLDLQDFIERHPTMFNWRIRVVLGAGEWILHDVPDEFYMEARLMWELKDWKWN
jgi:hypothetical protein